MSVVLIFIFIIALNVKELKMMNVVASELMMRGSESDFNIL